MLNTDTIQITPELLAPERLKALRHIATIESIGSSTRIEGNTSFCPKVYFMNGETKAHESTTCWNLPACGRLMNGCGRSLRFRGKI